MAIKLSGSFNGKSNKLGFGGRAAQLKAKGVPGGVIGNLARKAKAAPGQKNYHGKQTSLGKAKGVPVMKKPAYMKPRASKTLQKKMGF